MFRMVAVISSLLFIPSLSAAGQTPPSSKSIVRTNCTLPAGWADIARRKPRFVVFGEIHGIQEAPELVGNVACALATQGKHILVAVEHDVSFDAAYQAAWRQPPGKFEAALLEAGWQGADDGKSSTAMLAMLKRLHQLAWQGMPIHIAAFDGTRDDAQRRRFSDLPGQGPREAAQADNVRMAGEAGSYDLILVLTGNLHAQRQPFVRGGIAVEPMAMHLAQVGPMVTLNGRYSGGSAWDCQLKAGSRPEPGKPVPHDAVECAVHDLRPQPDLGPVPFVSLAASPGPGDPYDGFFWLGTLHGSPPALQAR